MQIIKRNYFKIAITLMFLSTLVNLIWKGKTWPGYFTFFSFILLLTLFLSLRIAKGKDK